MVTDLEVVVGKTELGNIDGMLTEEVEPALSELVGGAIFLEVA